MKNLLLIPFEAKSDKPVANEGESWQYGGNNQQPELSGSMLSYKRNLGI